MGSENPVRRVLKMLPIDSSSQTHGYTSFHMLSTKIVVPSAIGKKLSAILDFRPWGQNYWSEVFGNASIWLIMLENHMLATNISVLSAIRKNLAEPFLANFGTFWRPKIVLNIFWPHQRIPPEFLMLFDVSHFRVAKMTFWAIFNNFHAILVDIGHQ